MIIEKRLKTITDTSRNYRKKEELKRRKMKMQRKSKFLNFQFLMKLIGKLNGSMTTLKSLFQSQFLKKKTTIGT